MREHAEVFLGTLTGAARLSETHAMRTLMFTLLLALPVSAAPVPDKDKDEVKMPDAARKATARGLAWLAACQNSDGSWSDGRYPHNPAITSFALLAFLSQGHVPNQ